MVRELASLLLKSAGLALVRAAVAVRGRGRRARPGGDREEDDLPEVELPRSGTPLTAEALGMVAPPVKRETPEPELPLGGSVEERFAKARSFG